MACGGFACSKNALVALNVLYIMVAFILIGVAAYGKVVAYITSISIMGGIIACGVFLLIVAIIGLIGAIQHDQVLLFFYMIILFLVFLIQFAVACACLAINETQQKVLAQTGWQSAPPTMKNTVQVAFNCCGFDLHSRDNQISANQSEEQKHMAHPPCTNVLCCNGCTARYCSQNMSEFESQGDIDTCQCLTCYDNMKSKINEALKVSGGIGLFFSFTEIIGVWLALRYRNLKDPRANPSAFL